MADVEIPFAAQIGESSVAQNSREKLVNMYAEIETSGRKRVLRRQRAGLRQVYAITGEKRAIERYNDLHYCVIGSTFYSFDGTTLMTLGTLATNTGRCFIIFDDNGKVMVSDQATGYTWSGVTFATVTTPGSVGVGTLAYQGGFGIFNVPNAGQFYITALNNFTSVDALDFATAESAPDPIRRVFVDHNQLMLAGSRSIEIWQLSGAAFPFTPYQNAQIERGLVGPTAMAAEDNTVFFIGDDCVAYRLEGYRPVRISTGAVERAILAVPSGSQALCDAFVYTSGGQKFVNFRFPGVITLQYNLATGYWNYAQSFGYRDWQVVGSAGHQSSYLLTPTGIAVLDESINTDESGIMQRLAVSAPGDANGHRLSVQSLLLDVEVGRAATGVSASVMLRFAPDGETFGNSKTRALGLTGKYGTRVIYRNLGMGRKPVIEVSCTDDVRFDVMAAVATVTEHSN